MIRRFLTSLVGILSLSCYGQIAHWIVPPTFDDVEILPNGLVVVAEEQSSGLYDGKGNILLPKEYDIFTKFFEDIALLSRNNAFAGFVDVKGNVVDLLAEEYTPMANCLHFSNGFLVVAKLDKATNAICTYYIDKKGKRVAGPFVSAFPYFDGYALVERYANEKKQMDLYKCYLDEKQQEVIIPFFDKKQSIQFLSSFRDGRAVGIYKNKAYFISTDMTVTPIDVDDLGTKKSQLRDLVNIDSSINGTVITLKNGTLSFNLLMQLEKIESNGETLYSYKAPVEVPVDIKSEIDAFNHGDKYGLKYKGKVILPEQFEDVKTLPNEYALVKSDGKWGFINVDPKNQFQFKLNDNENIGFNHRFYTTKLATLMPSYIKCKNTTVYSKSDDCEIQVESRNEIENIERNTLTYDCKLSIPSSLSDTLVTKEYTYAIKYDGLQSIDYKVSIPEWYVKYYEVVLSNNKFTVNQNDTITVEFDLVKTDAARNDDTNYFKTVELITPDNENIPLNKITENHYSFRVGNGESDKMSFIVKITETGCPSIEYPFEMVFEKPAPKSKDKSVNVTVNAVRRSSKSKSAPAQQPTPEPIFVPK